MARAVRTVAVLAAVTGVSLAMAAPAGAHVGIAPSTTAAGATTVLEFSVPHGCDGSPTTELSIQIPTGVSAVVPTRSSLWDVSTEVVQLAQPVSDGHGNQVTERIESITYRTDEPLPDGVRDVLSMTMELPDSEGTQLWFPTIQRCERGETAWIEVAEDGQSEGDLELPAPTFVVGGGEAGGHHDVSGTPSAETTAADTGDQAAAAEDAPGATSSPALGLAGLGLGLLGAVLGGTALVRQRRGA